MMISEKTDPRAIRKIARALRLLDGLDTVALSQNDAFEVQLCKGLLKGMIDYSGYNVSRGWLGGIRLRKIPAAR